MFANLKDARDVFSALFADYSRMGDGTPERQRVWEELEKILAFALDKWSDDTRAIIWVVCSSKKDSELEERAIHALCILDKKKPFPGL